MAGPVTIGPTTPTDKQPFQTRVSTETVAVYIQNKSRMTLYVAFQDPQPTALDSTGGAYNGVVLPGHQALLPVQSRGVSNRERSLNAMGAFTGSVWIMPRDYTNTQAATGTVSSLVGVFVSAYGPYDQLPITAVDQPVIDLSSQPRVISMLPSGEQTYTGTWAPGAPPSILQLGTANAPSLLQTSGVVVYLYSLAITPTAATMGSGAFQLEAQPADILGNPIGAVAVLGAFTVAIFQQTGGVLQYINSSFIFTPAAPFPVAINFRPGAREMIFQLRFMGGSQVNITYMVNIGIGGQNPLQIPGIGNGGVTALLPPTPGATNTTLW